jgi:hypothetical protein
MLEGREAEAAIVAARLRAFQANPAHLGPRFAGGADPLPEGGILLRFAQGKIPAALAPSRFEAEQLRSAAELFVRRVCLWDGADHYQALCARPDAPQETIKENYHLLMGLLHPDRQEGAGASWPESCAQRVNLAYAALGDAAARREYDARLHTERPRHKDATVQRPADTRVRDVRFAKTLLVASSVIALVIAAGLLVQEDEWSDRSVLQASLARLRADPAPGADRPRYVGANSGGRGARASDAVAADDVPALDYLRPLMRAFSREEAKPYVAPVPTPAPAPVPAPDPAPVQAVAVPPSEPLIVARVDLPVAQAPMLLPFAQAQAAPVARTGGPTNADIENMVVALVSYYEAGDADRIVDMVDPDSIGFFRRNRLRQAYNDFFRATRTRQLRIDRLAWSNAAGGANARGEATVRAEYADRPSFEKHVDMALDIVVRDGKPRLARLELFPAAP